MNEVIDIVRDLLDMPNGLSDRDKIKRKAILKRANDFLNRNSCNYMTADQVIAKLKEMYGNYFYSKVSAITGTKYNNTEYPEIYLLIHEENTLNRVKNTFDKIANIIRIDYASKIVVT